MTGRRSGLWLVVLSACKPSTVDLDFPGRGYASEILIVERDGAVQDAFLYALDGTAIRTVVAPHLGDSVKVEALLYHRAPRELLFDIPSGSGGLRLDLSGKSPDLEPLPIPDAVYGASLSGGGDSAWTMEQGESTLALSVRIPIRDRRLCAGGDRCFRDVSGADPKCEAPCIGLEAIDPPAAPKAPSAPVLAPCPAGWAEDTSSIPGQDVCRPPPDVTCPQGQVQRAGSAVCAAPGDPCPTGTWPDGLGPGTIYVRSGAVGGAGTQASPFGTIAAALAQAGATATIALSQGSYTEAFALPGGITLRGACSTGVLVGAGAPDAVVTVAAGANALVDLAVMASGFGISISPGASAALRGVLVDGSRTASAAIVVHGALVAVDSAFLRAAVGVEVLPGGHAELDGVVVADNSEIGLSVDRASASLHRVAINLNGRTGILATDSALHASESIFDANMHAAIEIAGAQASATFARSLIQGTRPGPGAGDTPAAVYVWDRARVLFDRVLFDSNASMGLRVISGGALDLENVVVSDVAAVPSFGCGIGVAMTDGVLVARKLAVRRFHENALFLQGNTVADIEDISISSNVDPCIAPTGFVAADTASVAMRRAEFTAVRGRAIRFENPGAVTPGLRGHLSDIRVTGMSPMDDGVLLASSSSVTVERARFEGVGAFAVRISGSAHVTVKDVEVVSSQNHGFFISESAVATVIRARLASIGAAGAYGPQPSRADFTAITVDGAKNGFEANAGSVFTVRDFAVRHGAIGVLLDDPASSITLENGRIEDNQTGASFPAGFDTSALMRRVVFSNMQEFVAR